MSWQWKSYRLRRNRSIKMLHSGFRKRAALRSGAVKSAAIGLGLLLSRISDTGARFAGGRSGGRDRWLDILNLRIYPAALSYRLPDLFTPSLTLSVR